MNTKGCGYVTEEIFIWQHVPGIDNIRLFAFLKKKFGFDWLEKAEITKIGDGNSVIISYGNKVLSIKLNSENRSAILTMNGKKIYELVVSPSFEGFFSVDDTGDSPLRTLDFATKFFEERVKSLSIYLIITLALETIVGTSSFETISGDPLFMKKLEDSENGFRLQCQKFRESRKSWHSKGV
jgi:hypothetical protein